MATVLVLGQLCDPSSELHWAEQFYLNYAHNQHLERRPRSVDVTRG
jgi:hypothetical protein